jgi:hypothetical protein
MEEELERICGKISLTEGEQIGIAITEGDVVPGGEGAREELSSGEGMGGETS